MKKSILLFAFPIALASCTQKYELVPDPVIPDAGNSFFNTSIEQLPGEEAYVWNAGKDVVGVYSSDTDNCKYFPCSRFNGKSGEVEIYGPEVKGDVNAYFPYSPDGLPTLKEGRILIPSSQLYCTSADELIKAQSTLVGACVDSKISLRYLVGVLCVNLKADFENNVTEVELSCRQPVCGKLDISGKAQERITDASNKIAITGLDLPCSVASPLQIRFMLPEGEYTEIFVTAKNSGESVMAAVKSAQPVSVARCRETAVVAEVSSEEHDYSGSDFEEEEVQFD